MGTVVQFFFRALCFAGLIAGFSLVCLAPPGRTQDAATTGSPAAASASSAPDNPVADPKVIVTAGHARFTVLTPQLIRMEWSADGKFEDHASFVFINRRLPVPKFTSRTEYAGKIGSFQIKTQALELNYVVDGTPDAKGIFAADNLSIMLTVGGKQVTWHPGMDDPENLLGTTRTLDGAFGSKTKEPIEPGLVSRSGWALVDDSTRPLFDFDDFRFLNGEKSPWPWAMERPANEKSGSYLDWYFFGYGHDYRKALGDFVRVAGRIPLPPRFAFGIWWSRYWAYSDQELDQLVRGFRENDTPLDVLVIDMDWHINEDQLKAMGETDQSGQRLGWTGYTWNKLLFPDPEAFLKNLHDEGLKATLNLHPASGIQPWEQAYPAIARAIGIDPATKKYVPFDPTNKKWATNYFDLVLHPLEKQGIDFWWLDWQQQPMMTRLPGVNNTWWLNYLHFTDQQREGKRPLLFHRWGGLGNHRYEIGFSGDTISVWDSLAFQPWFTATAANVGYAYWSHDIGGHVPGAVGPELFTRWVQFGAFSPILRTHTTKNPDSERRIWAYPEPYSSILRSTYQLRMSLEPYVYTEARRTYDTGVAFLHPLYYDWPNEAAAYDARNEYMFGEMLAAPVVSPADTVTGLASEKIWLPAGHWIEWPTGKHLDGPAQLDRTFSIDQIPIYLKAGMIVPMQPPMLFSGQKPVDPLIVNVWPLAPGQSSSYSLYEDSGKWIEYQMDVFARTPVRAEQKGDTLEVEIGPAQGSYPGMLKSRSYQLRLPADWPPAEVKVNGHAVPQGGVGKPGWTFEGNSLTTIIPVPAQSTAVKCVIEVRRAPGSTGRRGELDGFAGTMNRLRGAYDALQQTWPVGAPPDPLIDAMQTGDRLGYHPERAVTEIDHLHDILPRAQVAVNALDATFAARLNDAAVRIGGAASHVNIEAEKQRRLDSLHRAEALLSDAGK
jgi:alpha-glucosidase (family GH31 glycosyl hydrolase)